MRNTNYTQWYNENEGRAYPLAEAATRVSDAGVSLPDDIIVDMGLMIDPGYTDIRVSSLRLTSRFISIGVSSSATGLLVGTYLRDAIQPYKAYPLVNAVDNVSGWVAFGTHRTTVTEDYRFTTVAQAGIELRAIRSVAALPVTGFLRLYNNPATIVDGIVRLKAGTGVKITKTGDHSIQIALDSTMQHAIISPCNKPATRETCKYTPIRSINGVCATPEGKITLRFE